MQREGGSSDVDLRPSRIRWDGADLFLDILERADRAPIKADDVAVVVAHPADETIGCGAQLERLGDVAVVVVTDGAPRNRTDAPADTPASATTDAKVRRDELVHALALGGIPEAWLIRFGIPDHEVARHLVDLTDRLNALFARRATRVALSHAYEGGHPDHDAVAFAVHAAARLRRLRGQSVSIVEMPYYADDPSGTAVQRFAPDPDCPETAVRLTERERIVKRRMLAAYRMQRDHLARFSADVERFRRSPVYDFTLLPNGGRLLYETQDWGMTGERWLTLARDALKQLELDGTP